MKEKISKVANMKLKLVRYEDKFKRVQEKIVQVKAEIAAMERPAEKVK